MRLRNVIYVLLLAPCALFAQEVSYPCQKLIEQGQYQKAVQKLNKMHDKTPNDCEVNYASFSEKFCVNSFFLLAKLSFSVENSENILLITKFFVLLCDILVYCMYAKVRLQAHAGMSAVPIALR